MPEDGKLRHCRHCLGDNCAGDCLLADGQCIHGWNGKRPGGVHWQMVLTRRWWHRVLWGPERGPRWHGMHRRHVEQIVGGSAPRRRELHQAILKSR